MATKVTSRREMVLKTLRSARRGKVMVNGTQVKTTGGWVPGTVLTDDAVGGVGGLRRLREIRTLGFAVEKRRIAGTRSYEYRLGTTKNN
ncbi:MAG: hypothetical protein EBU08_00340 [Micrococcales bacterium]|nr:hypothetical protein [Micrococcales bacterium]